MKRNTFSQPKPTKSKKLSTSSDSSKDGPKFIVYGPTIQKSEESTRIDSVLIKKRKQGTWDQERELVLMEAYNHYCLFAVSHRQVEEAWEQVTAAVNAVYLNYKQALTSRSVQNKKDVLFSKFQSLFDQHSNKKFSEVNMDIPTHLGRAIYSAMKTEEDAKSIKELKDLVKAGKTKDMRLLNDKLMSFAKYVQETPSKNEKKNTEVDKVPEVKPMPAKGQQQLVELLEKQMEILKRQAETNEGVLLVLQSLEKHIGESSKSQTIIADSLSLCQKS
ncbi:hypothetical protein J3Q64DRAFT_1837137 [Phycomyces blakesleeanus]|uniref:Uncharacterized protein n=2 Tax=Phycomyces blakesleeanus TaxID=4837 RepID=A0A163A2B8_PHYB8|nr:hypothetical protein PHYBLDRAFT_69584 [Phycomyces blakesleeanus NRRL 1555(-)]OAD70581.1 hypothetical protein PHYBLDRAFT_69584 [Phycomyces blakesleeanus NRRL 1555(-)]|eukprot:XP_018288621.1 hypothetical protein PHYBLDRAFT_69584 [Phycomyces blakesleeanus NRRL 1555(-)]